MLVDTDHGLIAWLTAMRNPQVQVHLMRKTQQNSPTSLLELKGEDEFEFCFGLLSHKMHSLHT